MNQRSEGQDFLHKEYPKQFARDEFWKQIKRTVNGESVSEQDIEQIVDQISSHLALGSRDHVLDLGCGNGALAARFFDRVDRYTGVDFSAYLLEVANEYFQPRCEVQYVEADIRSVDHYLTQASSANKVLIYGCIGYLSATDVGQLLARLRDGLPNLQNVFIGNVADQSRAADFFAARNIVEYQLDDPSSPIGVWWEQDDFIQMGSAVGFDTHCVSMPSEFYGGTYRFDVVLKKRHVAIESQ
ncbi:class I SAM-dependent methyltransferase [Planctomycetes bacterium K23_9]|uniref:Methyltransferase domain-containing protein n=1 Tax=Stieleria marina TaxID=1930275 RepID=A0A517P2F4_9BACT|nr:hypothetical protein K239x_55760 [Planctomycetes bacterium K23_9]